MQSLLLKQYERDILRARNRVEVADLDNRIDALIAALLGKLSRAEHKEYQASRIVGFIGVSPETIIELRVTIMGINVKRIASPDVLTLEESAELVLIMQEIANWLRRCQEAGEIDLAFAQLVDKAVELAQEARDRFHDLYQRYPEIEDVPDSLMSLARAQGIKRVADRARILMPPATE